MTLPMPLNEEARLLALQSLEILDTPREAGFDAITMTAKDFFGVAICLVSFVDAERQWFKSETGLDCCETPRGVAFCAHVVASDAMLVVPNASMDPRFATNPLVTGWPHIRFYAGCPIHSPSGETLGTICVIDTSPRIFPPVQHNQLRNFALIVEEQLRLRAAKIELGKIHASERELNVRLKEQTRALQSQNYLFGLASKHERLGAAELDLMTGKMVWSAGMYDLYEVDQHFEVSLDNVFRKFQYPDHFVRMIREANRNGRDYAGDVPIVTGCGKAKWLRIETHVIADEGRSTRRFSLAKDITGQKEQEASFKLLFEHNPVPMWVFDCETLKFISVNDAAIHHYGYSREWFLSKTIFDIRSPDHYDKLRDRLAAAVPKPQEDEDWYHLTADGRAITVSKYSSIIHIDGRRCELVAAIDVTDRRRQEAKILELAYQDSLTCLPNRRKLHEELEHALTANPMPSIALLILDLDHFKYINDTFGHAVGDDVLVAVAERLKSELDQSDLLARLGGDEFAIVITGLKDRVEVEAIVRRMIACSREPFCCRGHVLSMGMSIGVTFAPEEGIDVDTLMRNADLALYKAKAEGRNTYRFFQPGLHLRMIARHELELDLRKALERNEFELHYQPIVDLRDRRTVGYEALIRWNHPRRGLVGPAEFIPIAEETGLILPISDWVVETACMEAALWPERLKVAFNSSAVQFTAGTIVSSVQHALSLSGLPPDRLEVEITESLMIENTKDNSALLNQLREIGVSLALDDFGTGYSSLSYLQALPINKLKIDRSFVAKAEEGGKGMEILKTAVTLGKALDIITLAEGVETEKQASILLSIGCSQGQGYLFGKPQSLARRPNAFHRSA